MLNYVENSPHLVRVEIVLQNCDSTEDQPFSKSIKVKRLKHMIRSDKKKDKSHISF